VPLLSYVSIRGNQLLKKNRVSSFFFYSLVADHRTSLNHMDAQHLIQNVIEAQTSLLKICDYLPNTAWVFSLTALFYSSKILGGDRSISSQRENSGCISNIGIPCSFGSRSWLNFFSKLLLVKKLKSGALIGQKQVKHERELNEQGIPVLDIVPVLDI
jgi:hypothetical protein